MQESGKIEDTMFVPMLGRIYASTYFPDILFDRKALELADKLPEEIKGAETQTQYTLLASAARSANMDRYIKDFFLRCPDGVAVQLGCGLETAFDRCDNGINEWYEVDLPNVIEYRKTLLPESEREHYYAGSAFDPGWMAHVREKHPDAPVLVTASGLFYYFEHEEVIRLLKRLKKYRAEVVFDAVSKAGMKRMNRYMRQVGHEDAEMFFFVDRADELAAEIGNCKVLAEKEYYRHIPRRGMGIEARVSVFVSDLLNMVKMVHLELK